MLGSDKIVSKIIIAKAKKKRAYKYGNKIAGNPALRTL
jgi:hypothetical protein